MLCTGLSFVLDVYIGVTAEERKKMQFLEVQFEFQNAQETECRINDNSVNYVCYKEIIESIYTRFHHAEIKLLEYICYQIYTIIKSHVPQGMLINVAIKKICSDIVNGKSAEATCRYIEFPGRV